MVDIIFSETSFSHLTLVSLLYATCVDLLEIPIRPAVGLLNLRPLSEGNRVLLLLLPPLLRQWVEYLLLLLLLLLLALLLRLLPLPLVFEYLSLIVCLFLFCQGLLC